MAEKSIIALQSELDYQLRLLDRWIDLMISSDLDPEQEDTLEYRAHKCISEISRITVEIRVKKKINQVGGAYD